MIDNGKYINMVGKNADPNDNSGLPTWAVEKVKQCYEVCAGKNVVPPTVPNLDNLPETIRKIQVAEGVRTPLMVDNGVLKKVDTWSIAPATDVGDNVCAYLFAGTSAYPNENIVSADLSTLTQITGYNACYYMFAKCVNLSHAPLTNVKIISNGYAATYMFDGSAITSTGLDNLEEINGERACCGTYNNCQNLVSTGLHSLRKISDVYACLKMFQNDKALKNMDLENLEEINGVAGISEMFSGSGLETANFQKLRSVKAARVFELTFKDCVDLKDIYFPVLTTISSSSAFGDTNKGMLSGCSGVKVHFLKNLQNVIGNWAMVQNGFNGTNTTVLFDLGVDVTITAPLNTIVVIDGKVVFNGTQETESTVVSLPSGEHDVIAVNRELFSGVRYNAEVSEENPTISIDFDNFDYGVVTPTSNIDNATYDATIKNDYGLYNVYLQAEDGQQFRINKGTTIVVRGASSGDYVMFDPVEAEVTGDMTVEIEYVRKFSWFEFDANNFAEVLSPELPTEYWDVGENLTIHPTISTAYNTSKGISFIVPANTRKIRVATQWYVSSESNYDFGFLSLGTELVSPTASEIKNKIIANGAYLYRDTGTNNVMSWSNYWSNDVIHGENVLTIGWGQDSSTSSGTNTMYVAQIFIELYA